MLKGVEYTQARDILLSLPVRPRTERLPLRGALGRVLAEDVSADFPVPPFDKSPFDGFAFRACDVPGTLEVGGESGAGTRELPPLAPGAAIRIFTGAPVPEGADAVVKFEDADAGSGRVTIASAFAPGTNVIRAGEDIGLGELAARAGSVLSPALLGVLASLGRASLRVYGKPQASIICTGTELTEPGEPRPKYGIYNSSVYSLCGYLRSMGFETRFAGAQPDDEELISSALASAMDSDADVVMMTGGASVGDYDFAMRAVERIGARTLFWKVKMKPGGALLAAERDGKLCLGLSGNPAAALMSLLVVLQPCLRRYTGARVRMEELRLPLRHALPKVSSGCRMLRGRLLVEDGRAWFLEAEGRGNGNIASFNGCDLIGVIPGGTGMLPANSSIKALRLPPDLCRWP